MSDSEKLYDLFYLFVRAGLHENVSLVIGKEISDEIWLDLFEMARMQAVGGIFIEGVARSGVKPGNRIWMRWLGYLVQLQRMNRKVEEKGRKWLEELKTAGMMAEVFKGVEAGKWYPDPLARSSGDIDLVIIQGWERAEEFLKSRGVEYRDEHGDLVFKEDGIPLELHKRREYLYSPFADRKLRRLLASDKQSKELFAVCLILHFRRHVLTYGCGLKQVCDIVMMLRRADLDGFEMRRLLKALKLEKFSRTLFGFIRKRFGVTDFPLLPVYGSEVRLLEDIIHRDGYMLKKEREGRALSLSAWKRMLGNACFWMRRCVRLFPLMPGEALWFPLFLICRRLKEALK